MSINPALDVRCPHCMAAQGEHCTTTPWPGKDVRTRRPLRWSVAHPQRVALAACFRAGAEPKEAHDAARAAVTYYVDGADSLPYIEIARQAISDAARVSLTAYRQKYPPAKGVDLGPDLFNQDAPEPEASK